MGRHEHLIGLHSSKKSPPYISSLPIAGNGRRGREKAARLGEWGSQSVPVPPTT